MTQQAVATPAPPAPADGGELAVVNEAGEVGTLPREQAIALRDAGKVRPATNEEFSHAQKKAELGGFVQGRVAEGIGAVRGLASTVGLPADAAALQVTEAVGGKQSASKLREYLQGQKEVHPFESGFGEFGGMVGGTIAGGGVGIAKVGSAARSLAGGGKVLGGLAAGAAEGALYSGVEHVNEDALGDHATTAESLIAEMGHGALVGGLLGGGIGGVELGAGAAKNSIGRLLSRAQTGEQATKALAQGKLGGLVDGYAKAAAATSGTDANVIRELLENPEARRVAAFEAPAMREQAARDVKVHLDDLLESTKGLTDEARGALKREYVAKAVAGVDKKQAAETAWSTISNLKADVQAMASDAKKYGLGSTLKSMDEYLEGQAGRIRKAAQADDVAEMFSTLDDTKRALGKWTKAAQAVEKSPDPLKLVRGRETRDELQAMYERTRAGLEDHGVWGKAAQDQAAINKAWAKHIDSSRMFESKLTTTVGRDPANPWVDIRRVDPAKADSYVRNLTNANNDLVHKGIKDYVDSSQELARAIGGAYELPAEKAALVARAAKSAESFGGAIAKGENALVRANQLEQLLAAEKGGTSLMGMALAASMGPLGVVGGIAGHALSRPGTVIKQIAAAERMGQNLLDLVAVQKAAANTKNQITSGVRGFLAPAKQLATAAGGASKAVARGGVRAASRAGAVAMLPKEKGEDDTRALARITADVARAAANPKAHAAAVAESTRGLGRSAPNTSASIAATSGRAIQFLAAKIPKGTRNDEGLQQHLMQARIPVSEMARFARYYAAVDRPMRIVEELQAGTLSHETVEAVREVYPKLYEQVRNEIITTAAEAKEPLPYEKVKQLSILFDAPLDETFTRGYIVRSQQVYAQVGQQKVAEGQARQARPGPKASAMGVTTTAAVTTPLQSVMGGTSS